MAAEARDFSYIPMISVAGLGRGDAAATDRVVAEIGAACETAGCPAVSAFETSRGFT